MLKLEPIEVRQCGTGGPTLVVLHGGPGAPGSAHGLAQSLADKFVVLEPIQRRSGQVSMTVAQHVEDLRAVMPVPATIVGWSWGAMLGLSFAASYPEHVNGLVLVGCGTYDESSRKFFRAEVKRALGPCGVRRIADLEIELAGQTESDARNRILDELGRLYMTAETYEPLDIQDDDVDHLPADALGHNETWNDVLRLQREGVEPARFTRISAPVLMIHGAVDPHPGPVTRELLRAFIPGLEYVEIERCGHEPWRERYARARFIRTVQTWCNALNRR